MNKYQSVIFAALTANVVAQDPSYYKDVDLTAKNNELKEQLHDLINPHTVISYDDAYDAFAIVDRNLPTYPCSDDLSMIPDIYSATCWMTNETLPGGECGNYQVEGDCFNREHSWPKSWFGGFDAGANAQSDLFELYPSDGYVNGLRGNLPLGYVDLSTDVSYISTNGGMVGNCLSQSNSTTSFSTKDLRYKPSSQKGFDRKEFINAIEAYKRKGQSMYSTTETDADDANFDDDFWATDDNHIMDDDYQYDGKCFEVADMFKGDLARTYFYLSTAYLREWSCCDDVGVDKSFIKPWMEAEMREWHVSDPVDSYEIARNNVIYTDYQHNRNPYIDYPELVDSIEDF